VYGILSNETRLNEWVNQLDLKAAGSNLTFAYSQLFAKFESKSKAAINRRTNQELADDIIHLHDLHLVTLEIFEQTPQFKQTRNSVSKTTFAQLESVFSHIDKSVMEA
jgi:hypothetical protein